MRNPIDSISTDLKRYRYYYTAHTTNSIIPLSASSFPLFSLSYHSPDQTLFALFGSGLPTRQKLSIVAYSFQPYLHSNSVLFLFCVTQCIYPVFTYAYLVFFSSFFNGKVGYLCIEHQKRIRNIPNLLSRLTHRPYKGTNRLTETSSTT